MTLATIRIQIDDQAARIFEATPEIKRERLQNLIGFLVQEFAESTPESLLALMDKMSTDAGTKGLTPEILASILNDNG